MYQSFAEKAFRFASQSKQRAAVVFDCATGRVIGTVAATGVALSSGSAFAAGPDLSSLTAAVDYSTVGPAILVVGAAAAAVYIVWKGAKMVVSAIKTM